MTQSEPLKSDLGLTLSMLLLRLWLAVRALLTGVEKFAGTSTGSKKVMIDGAPNAYGLSEAITSKAYAFSNYQGVPAPIYEKFSREPFIPAWGLDIYNIILGPALLILGFTLLAGIATRFTLFAMGLLYTSLTFGLILIKQDAGVAWIGIHILMIVGALALANYNRFTLLKKW